MDTVYIETSIVSHATAWPSKDQATAILQQQARQWWDQERSNYRLVTSQFVIDEAADGDSDAARLRLEMLNGIPLLRPSDRVEQIAEELIRRSLLPEKAKLDGLHIALAAVGGVHYLLTQNCKNIANAHVLPRVYGFAGRLRTTAALDLHACRVLGRPRRCRLIQSSTNCMQRARNCWLPPAVIFIAT